MDRECSTLTGVGLKSVLPATEEGTFSCVSMVWATHSFNPFLVVVRVVTDEVQRGEANIAPSI